MAKNLKLKIKNSQLAEALNLNKKVLGKSAEKEVKKTTKKPTKAKAKAAPEEVAAKPKPVRKVKAKDIPDHIKNANAPESKEDNPKESPDQIVETAALASEETVTIETPKDGTTPAKTEDKAETVKEANVEKPASEPEEVKVPGRIVQPKTTTTTSKDKPLPKKEIKPEKTFKDTKEAPKKAKEQKPAKKFESKSFDARDRQGLRDSEDGSWRRRRPRFKQKRQESNIPVVRPSELTLQLPISVKDLAAAMKRKASELISKLFMHGVVHTINDYLDDETLVQLIGSELNCEITIDTTEQERLQITGKSISEEISEASSKNLTPRAPVIAFMGHVDHGKTSLIDALRKSNLTSHEAGAITQHIGAFQCLSESGNITILDTPGHEAFTEMRQRGATVTDIVILVIAGDEGMMPQTKEAIKHAKEAKAPIIVAINKCDKQGFNVDDVYRQLAEQELLPEAWGGEIITVNCSATTGEGISSLVEMILLQSEVLELKADATTRARGTVIESQLHRGLGSVATILVQNGSLKIGDALVFDDIYGRVKTMHDDQGKSVQIAGPSSPVKITGLSGIPEAGCEFIGVENEKEARKICEERSAGVKRASLRRRSQSEIEGLLTRSQELSQKKVLNIILRADVQGSLEAVKISLMKIPSDKVELNIITEGVGQISESDVQLAEASNAAIIGFHTQVESHAEPEIAKAKLTVKLHDIIYHLINDVKDLMEDQLDKIRTENEAGEAEVRAVFKASHLGAIAGCQVIDGIIKRNHYVKVFRGEEIVYEGEIASLKRVKDDVKEVSKGLECGILLNNFNEVQEGDRIKTYEITYLKQEL